MTVVVLNFSDGAKTRFVAAFAAFHVHFSSGATRIFLTLVLDT